jgi:aldose 1-epimerase
VGCAACAAGRDLIAGFLPDQLRPVYRGAVLAPWTPTRVDDSSAVLTTRPPPQPGYPFQLDLTATYELDSTGLAWQVDAVNTGVEDAPCGASVHPDLIAGAGRVDDWTLTLPADRWLDVDPERLLPTRVRDVQDTPFDLRTGRPLHGGRAGPRVHATDPRPGRAGPRRSPRSRWRRGGPRVAC